jgi:hypothetical protein
MRNDANEIAVDQVVMIRGSFVAELWGLRNISPLTRG